MGLCIKELDRIYGIREGSNNKKGDNRLGEGNNFIDQSPKNEQELLKSLGLGIDKRTIQNYKKLTELIPELEELVDTGIATPTTALAIIRNLSEETGSKKNSNVHSMHFRKLNLETNNFTPKNEEGRRLNENREYQNRQVVLYDLSPCLQTML